MGAGERRPTGEGDRAHEGAVAEDEQQELQSDQEEAKSYVRDALLALATHGHGAIKIPDKGGLIRKPS